MMTEPAPHSLRDLQKTIQNLKKELEEYRLIEREYHQALKSLKEKEAFNFALFHYIPVTAVVVDRQGKVVKSNAAKLRSQDKLPQIGDVMYRDYAAHHGIDMHAELMNCIETDVKKSFPCMTYRDKTLSITIAPFPGGAIITSRDITAARQAEADRTSLIAELRRALNEVETLRTLLPICASCKKIRDDKGYWNHIEEYFSRFGKVDFSHTLCPSCAEDLYPDVYERSNEEKGTVAES